MYPSTDDVPLFSVLNSAAIGSKEPSSSLRVATASEEWNPKSSKDKPDIDSKKMMKAAQAFLLQKS